ncbi:MAG: 50S ribosomal protein L3 [Gammaproteobacteria bacterium]|nr:50S ribosomal protein L3 [Gammaproteobacteria bacterium]
MTIGLIGKKCGMTRIFSEDGKSAPVTVVTALPNRVVQIKSDDNDGYRAVQVTTGSKKASKVSKPLANHYARANVGAGDGLWEWRLEEKEGDDLAVGKEFKVDLFAEGQMVDVSGYTKGKGFAGVIKRHHFAGGRASHGNSLSHRVPGSIGQRQTPGRVFKGKKMAGHLGNVKRTVQNQEIVRIDNERNLIMIKGVVPGAPGSYVIVKPAVKNKMKGGE